MFKQRIYLDTSVISHLQHEDAPEKMRDTISFWKDVSAGEYEVVISDVTLNELTNCPEPKRGNLFSHLERIDYSRLATTSEAKILAEAYVDSGVLTRRNENDCLHIALAVTSGCDVIVSWNFKHMVRMTTIQRVRLVNSEKGYFKSIDIVSPTTMLKEEENDA